jgi:hypothetical protein
MRRLIPLHLLLASLSLAICATARADVFGPISLVSNDPLEQAEYAHNPAISGNGRYVVFDGYLRGQTGVWRRDLQTGEVVPVAVGEPETAAGSAELPSISDNGQYVSFTTTAALSPSNDQNIGPDVYVRNMSVGEFQPCEETVLHPSQPCPFTLASAVSGSTQGLTYTYVKGPERETEELSYGSMAAGRSALSSDGQKVVFVTSAPSDLDGEGTPQLEVAVRDLESGQTQLVSSEYGKAPGTPVLPQKEGERSGSTYGAVFSTGKPPAFKPPEPYSPTAQVPASISADGSTVAWLGQDIGEQARTLSAETLRASYSEPLWRRIADGESAPTRRITGGSDPGNPACAASGETVLPEQPSLSDPCQGPFATTTNFGVWTGGAGEVLVPRLSSDGYTVAFIAKAPLASLGADFGVERTNRHSDLYVADMHEGLSRVQALTPLTELASGNESDRATNSPIVDFAISPDASQVAFTTVRTVFPLGSPAYVSEPASVPGMLELFDVDLANDTLTRVSHGYEGGPSEHPHANLGNEDPYFRDGDGALSPSFSDNDETLAFASTASNLVYGDGNTPPLLYESLDGSDAFVVDRIIFNSTAAPQEITAAPADPALIPAWKLGATALSLPNGTVRLYVELPGAGKLKALAGTAVTVRTVQTVRTKRGRRKVTHTSVVQRNVASAAQSATAGSGGLATVSLTLGSSYRTLAARAGGLPATVNLTFTAAGHPALHESVLVSFLKKSATTHPDTKSKKSSRRSKTKAHKR